jgi:hypothetical protein
MTDFKITSLQLAEINTTLEYLHEYSIHTPTSESLYKKITGILGHLEVV